VPEDLSEMNGRESIRTCHFEDLHKLGKGRRKDDGGVNEYIRYMEVI